MLDFKWTSAEKKVAKRAFDAALNRENAAILQKLKTLAETATTPTDIWDIHDFLSEQNKMIANKYDYRYSQLIMVFGQLLREDWLDENDLAGLSEEKLNAIVFIASL